MIIRYISYFLLSFTLTSTVLVGAILFTSPQKLQTLKSEIAYFDIPQIYIPNLTVPQVTLPDFEMPSIQLPEFKISNYVSAATTNINDFFETIIMTINYSFSSIGKVLLSINNDIATSINDTYNDAKTTFQSTVSSSQDFIAQLYNSLPPLTMPYQVADSGAIMNDGVSANEFNSIQPAVGLVEINEKAPEESFKYPIIENEIAADTVLVPREKTVISSSRDGKILKINFQNGERFQRGDVLLEYDCTSVESEISAANLERSFAKSKMLTTSRLFDLKIASSLEKEQTAVEDKLAEIKEKISQTRLNDCIIRAAYDGHVVKRLANPNEYTRTDRVLMEVASAGTLDAEFLIPSIWLRWINIGAPLKIKIFETDKEYTGEIKRIYGEVDPVSQSIQIRATIHDYDDPLLPGMSGEVMVNVGQIREAGIQGYLETMIK